MPSAEDLLAFLVAEGCLPMVAGERPRATPPPGALVPHNDRAGLGFTGPGVTMRYAADAGEVIADFGAVTATLRIAQSDLEDAADRIEKAIRATTADTQSSEDAQDADGKRWRTFFVRVSERRYARISISLPDLGGPPRAPLEVRVTGMAALGQAG